MIWPRVWRRLIGTRGAGAPARLQQSASVAECARAYEACAARKDYAGAVHALEAALRLQPDWIDAWHNLGTMLAQLGRLAEAESAFRRVLHADPGRRVIYRLLGNVLQRQGRIAELLQVLSVARRSFPDDFELESFELVALLFDDSASGAQLLDRHRAYGARLEQATPVLPPAAPADPRRPLRVGFVSGDLCVHPVAQFLRPVLAFRDRALVETYCYSVGASVDFLTREIATLADRWRDAAQLDDAQLAQAIRADGIDVLVDLSGHLGISRLPVFARQPTPVQLAWLGYLHSTGLTRIGYRIVDARSDPAETADALHTEKLVRLPHSQWCYRPLVETGPPVEPGPTITFGAFNQVSKVSPATRRLWIEVLRAVPGARLACVGIPAGPASDRLRTDFAAGGIDPARLDIAPHVPVAEYFARLRCVTAALDTTPYSGGTTTFDALWMGVPVITLLGERSVSRSAASILQAVGMDDWVARNTQEYVGLALRAARSPHLIATLRTSLRGRLSASPLTDEPRFAQDFTRLVRGLAYT